MISYLCLKFNVNLILLFCAIVQWNTRKCCLCFIIIHAIFVFFPLPQFLLSVLQNGKKTQNLSFSWRCLKISPLIAKHSHLAHSWTIRNTKKGPSQFLKLIPKQYCIYN